MKWIISRLKLTSFSELPQIVHSVSSWELFVDREAQQNKEKCEKCEINDSLLQSTHCHGYLLVSIVILALKFKQATWNGRRQSVHIIHFSVLTCWGSLSVATTSRQMAQRSIGQTLSNILVIITESCISCLFWVNAANQITKYNGYSYHITFSYSNMQSLFVSV